MPAETDLKIIIAFGAMLILWGLFNVFYAGGQLEDYNEKLPEYKEQGDIFGALTLSTAFLNPFSDFFNPEIFIINTLIFMFFIFIGFVLAMRYARG